jgi:hypothetical protein
MANKRLIEVLTAGEGSEDIPEFSNEDYDYLSYFQNKNGAHLVFVYDGDEEIAELYNSKEGWDEKTTITREEIMDSDFHLHYDQEEGESKWLHSVVLALQPRFKTVSYDP